MAKIDEIKEILNTLRVVLTIIVGLATIITGSVISRIDAGRYDFWSWCGVVSIVLLSISLVFVAKLLSKRTKEIKDL